VVDVLGEFIPHGSPDFIVALGVKPVGGGEALEVGDRLDVPNDDAGHVVIQLPGRLLRALVSGRSGSRLYLISNRVRPGGLKRSNSVTLAVSRLDAPQ
jgi:hypothetical protein